MCGAGQNSLGLTYSRLQELLWLVFFNSKDFLFELMEHTVFMKACWICWIYLTLPSKYFGPVVYDVN